MEGEGFEQSILEERVAREGLRTLHQSCEFFITAVGCTKKSKQVIGHSSRSTNCLNRRVVWLFACLLVA